MKKYVVLESISTNFTPTVEGCFDTREDAVALASLLKKNQPNYEFAVYCLDARIIKK